MSGIIDERCWAGIDASVIIDIVPIHTLLTLVHGADIAKIGTGNAGEAIGIRRNGALLQTLVII
jgi:hypothetical protein